MIVSPSILAADVLNLERDVRKMVEAGTDWLHVDIMDAHFVPNLSFSPALTDALHQRFPGLPLDVHLMMDNPEKYIDAFCKAGAYSLTIHAEIEADVSSLLKKIREYGVKTGLSVKPGTPASAIAPYLDEADMVLVMTVEPGFGGQKFNAGMLEKIADLRKMGYRGLIEADGGVSLGNLEALRDHGLDVAVMGTALFRSSDPRADMERIHQM